MNNCSVTNCTEQPQVRGLCNRHYRQWLVEGIDNDFYREVVQGQPVLPVGVEWK